MINQNLSSKLKAYSMFAGTLVGTATALEADVIYTEIDPEVELPVAEIDDTNTYTLSLNGDSSASFYFVNKIWLQYHFEDGVFLYSTAFNYFMVRGINSGSVGGTNAGIPMSSAASMFNEGEMIGPDNNWIQPSSSLWYYGAVFFVHRHKQLPGGTFSGTFSTGEWLGATDKYIALRFTKDANYHYGWVRLSIDATTRVPRLSGYAYESDANKGLYAGTNQIAINSIEPILGNAIVNGDMLQIQLETALSSGSMLYITSIDGKQLVKQPVAGKQIQITLPGHAVGTYIINIQSVEGVFTQKMYIP